MAKIDDRAEISIDLLLSSQYRLSDRDFSIDQLPTESENQSVQEKSVAGRKKKKITKLLAYFQYLKPTKRRVNMEYLKISLLRGFKRALREVIEGVTPRKKVHGIDPNDLESVRNWDHFRTFVGTNPFLETFAPTKAGPATEAKAKRSNFSKTKTKTFNDSFCLCFFSNAIVRTAFRLYLDVIFTHEDSESLKTRLKFEAIGMWEEGKMESWRKLKKYLYCGWFQELKVPDEEGEENLAEVKA